MFVCLTTRVCVHVCVRQPGCACVCVWQLGCACVCACVWVRACVRVRLAHPLSCLHASLRRVTGTYFWPLSPLPSAFVPRGGGEVSAGTLGSRYCTVGSGLVLLLSWAYWPALYTIGSAPAWNMWQAQAPYADCMQMAAWGSSPAWGWEGLGSSRPLAGHQYHILHHCAFCNKWLAHSGQNSGRKKAAGWHPDGSWCLPPSKSCSAGGCR